MQRHSLFWSITLLIITMSTLAWIAQSQQSLTKDKDWWAISFTQPSPTSDSLQFTIENYSNNESFIYSITGTGAQSSEGTIQIKKGEQQIVSPPTTIKPPAQITVTSNNTSKEIYK